MILDRCTNVHTCTDHHSIHLHVVSSQFLQHDIACTSILYNCTWIPTNEKWKPFQEGEKDQNTICTNTSEWEWRQSTKTYNYMNKP